MPEVPVRGLRLTYDVQPALFDKSSVAVVFIHGSGGDREDWNDQLSGLSDSVTAIALDLPGHGSSEPVDEASVPAYAQIVSDFVENVGLQRVVLVGCSLGSAIVQQIALSPPQWLIAIGLVGSGARLKVHPAFLEGLIKNKESALKMLRDYCVSPTANETLLQTLQDKFTVESAERIHQDLSACNDFNIMDRVQDITVPTCIIVGEDDKLTPVKYSQFLQKSISGSQLNVVPGAGHLVMTEKPNDFNRHLREFLYSAKIIHK
jgi:pimeloyl-ACP methyl ester carboxylesterase